MLIASMMIAVVASSSAQKIKLNFEASGGNETVSMKSKLMENEIRLAKNHQRLLKLEDESKKSAEAIKEIQRFMQMISK